MHPDSQTEQRQPYQVYDENAPDLDPDDPSSRSSVPEAYVGYRDRVDDRAGDAEDLGSAESGPQVVEVVTVSGTELDDPDLAPGATEAEADLPGQHEAADETVADETVVDQAAVDQAAVDQAAVDQAAVDQADNGQPGSGMKPGDAPVQPVGDVWTGERVDDIRRRWREALLLFVDDPRHAVGEVRAVVAEAVDEYTSALAARCAELDSWQAGGEPDTERLRVVVQRYRDLLERVLAR